MIYELAIVLKSKVVEEDIVSVKELVIKTIAQFEGEVYLSDDWGQRMFAQTAKNGTKSGHYLYFIYKSNGSANSELGRLFKINELVYKHIILKLSDVEEEKEVLLKAYKTPYSKEYNGSITDNLEKATDRDKKRFASRNSCWFSVNRVRADWKDPKTYNWLVNDFGKISPARVTGISTKHQRYVETAIKRARNIGLISHLASRFAE